MSSPDVLHYHHDRADLQGMAWLVGIGGLAVLGVVLPILHKFVPGQPSLIVGGIAVLVWFALVLGLGWRARQAAARPETVAFDTGGFTSRLFGRVDFADIKRTTVGYDTKLWRWEIAAPSLTLTLADRRRLHCHLDARHYRTDLLDYMAFVDTVRARVAHEPSSDAHPDVFGCARVFGDTPTESAPPSTAAATGSAASARHVTGDRRERRASSNAASGSTSASPDRARRVRRRPQTPTGDDRASARNATQGSAASRMSRANQGAEQRFRQQMKRHGKWAALAMVLLPLSYMIRTCDMSAIKPGPLDGMAERAPEALETSRSLLQTAIAQTGPVYLWSNTPADAVKPVLAPNIKTRAIGIDTLDTMNTAGDLMDFVINDEAEGYRMGIQHDGTLALSDYSKISLRPVDGERMLFFFVLPPEGADVQSQTGRALPDISWRVAYRHADDIANQIDQADKRLPMTLVTRWMQMTPPPRVMIAAAAYHGMTDTDFDAAIAQVKADFERRGIDTSGFETQRFEAGTVRQPDAQPGSTGEVGDAANDDSQARATEARDGSQ